MSEKSFNILFVLQSIKSRNKLDHLQSPCHIHLKCTQSLWMCATYKMCRNKMECWVHLVEYIWGKAIKAVIMDRGVVYRVCLLFSSFKLSALKFPQLDAGGKCEFRNSLKHGLWLRENWKSWGKEFNVKTSEQSSKLWLKETKQIHIFNKCTKIKKNCDY